MLRTSFFFLVLCALAASLLASCQCTCCAEEEESAAAPAAGAEIAGGEWTLVELYGQPIPTAQETPTLSFDAAQGTASGSTGVNRYTGDYQTEGDRLQLGPLATTRRAGPPELMEREAGLLRALGSASHFQISGDALELRDGNGLIVARFQQR